MKNLLFLLVLVFVGVSVHAQQSQNYDNTIELQTSQGFDEAFRTIGRHLVSNGLTIEDANKDFGTITTKGVRIGNRMDPVWEMKITAMITDEGQNPSKIILTAMVRNADKSWERLNKRGSLHMFGKGWTVLETIAYEYKDAAITFKREAE